MLICPDFSKTKVVVVGDAMLDRYWHGDTSRISPEAPVPVVKIDHAEERVGGAANVALNVKALGAQVKLISVIGEDDVGARLQEMMQTQGVDCHFIRIPNIRTTLKLRVLGRNQQLIRLDFEDKNSLNPALIIERLAKIDADVLILSDYAKGVISQPQVVIDFALSKGMKVVVDPKNPDLSVYRNATILTPNLMEFEAQVGACPDDETIERKGHELIEKLCLDSLLVTRGGQGMSLLTPSSTKHIPANAREVFDITGAGDTVIAVLGTCLAANTTLTTAAELANIAGGISVGRLGTATVSPQEINNFSNDHQTLGTERGVVSIDSLLNIISVRKRKGDKIVMTNGCFDVLHAGHVSYLEEARSLGDCLIVAVNDDLSVKRLKGPTRPVNSLAQRMKLLSALACVDYVVSFSEDTPEALISAVLPHVLVKGGDYRPEEIAGGKQVIQNGGVIKILPFVPGCSTTSMLERLVATNVEVGEAV